MTFQRNPKPCLCSRWLDSFRPNWDRHVRIRVSFYSYIFRDGRPAMTPRGTLFMLNQALI